jgi:hypothetical protein
MNSILLAGAIRIPVRNGLVSICAWCKRCRDDGGIWQPVDAAILREAGAQLSHTICSECAKTAFGVLKRGK